MVGRRRDLRPVSDLKEGQKTGVRRRIVRTVFGPVSCCTVIQPTYLTPDPFGTTGSNCSSLEVVWEVGGDRRDKG